MYCYNYCNGVVGGIISIPCQFKSICYCWIFSSQVHMLIQAVYQLCNNFLYSVNHFCNQACKGNILHLIMHYQWTVTFLVSTLTTSPMLDLTCQQSELCVFKAIKLNVQIRFMQTGINFYQWELTIKQHGFLSVTLSYLRMYCATIHNEILVLPSTSAQFDIVYW